MPDGRVAMLPAAEYTQLVQMLALLDAATSQRPAAAEGGAGDAAGPS